VRLLQSALYGRLEEDLPKLRHSVSEALASRVFDDDRPSYMANLFLTFEVEVLCRTQHWERVQAVVEV
jgi:hypothetical protein